MDDESCDLSGDDHSATVPSADSSSSSDDDEDEDPTVTESRLVTEARFSVRSEDDEDGTTQEDSTGPRHRRRALPSFVGCGDDDGEDGQDVTAAGRSLASTMNSISQRNNSKGRIKSAPEMEDTGSDDERTMRALAMMDAEVGGDGNSEEDDARDAELDDSMDEGEDNDFYSMVKKKRKQKKEFKKDMYTVAPKYPVMEEEVDAERSVGNMIMKNRGLVAHKAKINRNPRVKKREQYRKALIRRKGTVREVRTDEGHKYAGETTGIKAHLSRSRKL